VFDEHAGTEVKRGGGKREGVGSYVGGRGLGQTRRRRCGEVDEQATSVAAEDAQTDFFFLRK
jgi:hypothetical protein